LRSGKGDANREVQPRLLIHRRRHQSLCLRFCDLLEAAIDLYRASGTDADNIAITDRLIGIAFPL
jgi:hypothetical protein